MNFHDRRDDAQDLANHLGRDLHVGSDGLVRSDRSEAISSERSGHGDATQGKSGGCGQHEGNISSSEE